MSGVGCRDRSCETSHDQFRDFNEDHVIRHVTCLGASEDYTSRRDLESSEIQHVISKMFRDERRIATKSTIAKRVLSEGSCMCSIEKQ